jgi:2-hydroxy-3-oxopropionate reductase
LGELVGFIGLGVMGRPMARNLVEAGYEVRGFSRGRRSREAAEALGIPLVGSVAEAVVGVGTVVTILPDTPDVELVALGPDGVLDRAEAATSYIDMSTIEPTMARRLHASFAERGIAALDAPVSGGEQGAVDGTLSIMVGGDEQAFAANVELLGAMGTTVVRVGDAGSGQVVKAANQLMVAGHLQMLAEALVFLEAHGVDANLALSVINQGLAGSTVVSRKASSMLNGDLQPGFRVALHMKDLGIVEHAARDRGLALPATAMVAQWMQSLVAQGYGALDHAALYLLVKMLNSPSAASTEPAGSASGV